AKSVVALGVLEALTKKFPRVGVFRSVTPDSGVDVVLDLLLANTTIGLDPELSVGVSYREMHEAPEKALGKILENYKRLEQQCDAVVVIGSDYTDIFSPAEFSFNARVAANLGVPMVLVFNGREVYTTSEHLGQADPRNSQDLLSMAELAMQEVREAHTTILAAVVN
ncbi:MAG: AAA family ATPase, partial [Aquiluna sp.]